MEEGIGKPRKRKHRKQDEEEYGRTMETERETNKSNGNVSLNAFVSLERCNETGVSSNSSIPLQKNTSRLKSSERTNSGNEMRREENQQSTTTLETGHYECVLCCKKFPTLVRLYRHKTTRHQEDPLFPFSCPEEDCGERFSAKKLLRRHQKDNHKSKDDPLEFTHFCHQDLCGMGFFTLTALEEHKRKLHDPSVKMFRCNLCPESFFQRFALSKHMKQSHVKEKKKKPKRNESSSENVPSTLMIETDSESLLSLEPDEDEEHKKSKKPREKQKTQLIKEPCKGPDSSGNFNGQSPINYVLGLLKKHEKDLKKLIKCRQCSQMLPSQEHLEEHIKIVHEKPTTTFICKVCERKFKYKKNYVVHLRTHSQSKCPHCSKIISSHESLKDHVMAVHGKPKPTDFKCDVCGKEFPNRKSYLVHREIHTKNPTCHHCSKTMTTVWRLKEHIKIVHEKATDFKCEVCGKGLPTKAYYRVHRKRHMKDLIPNAIFKCEVCGKEYGNRQSYLRHRQRHTNTEKHKCPHCSKTFATRNCLKLHMKVIHEKATDFKCEDCGKGFPIKTYYLRHRKTHMTNTKCEQCSKVLSTPQSLADHIKSFHEKPTGFKCDICGKGFLAKKSYWKHRKTHKNNTKCPRCSKTMSSIRYLKKHIKNVHENRATVECEICWKQFRDKSYYLLHRKFHKKNTKCPHCPKKMYSCHLEEHIKIVHEKVNSFKCEVCEEEFPVRRYYLTHLETHSKNTKCRHCSKTLLSLANLIKHIKVKHQKETSFKCEKCGKGFATMKSCLIHQKSHEKKKCPHCPKMMTRVTYLKDHIKTVHEKATDFKCENCGKGFPTKWYYDRHRRSKRGCRGTSLTDNLENDDKPES